MSVQVMQWHLDFGESLNVIWILMAWGSKWIPHLDPSGYEWHLGLSGVWISLDPNGIWISVAFGYQWILPLGSPWISAAFVSQWHLDFWDH